jgi:hypothetical protein
MGGGAMGGGAMGGTMGGAMGSAMSAMFSSFVEQRAEVVRANAACSDLFANITEWQKAVDAAMLEDIAERRYGQSKLESEIKDAWKKVEEAAENRPGMKWLVEELIEQAMELEIKLQESKVYVATKVLWMAKTNFITIMTESTEKPTADSIEAAKQKVMEAEDVMEAEGKAMRQIVRKEAHLVHGFED